MSGNRIQRLASKIRRYVGPHVIGASRRRRRERFDFIGVGAQRSGTTTLFQILQRHPDIELPQKQVSFFTDDARFDGGHRPSGGYGDLHGKYYFHRRAAGQIVPDCLFWRDCLARIHAYNPDIRTIALLRNPVERAYSQWSSQIKRRQTTRSFLDQIAFEIEQTRSDPRFQTRHESLVARGRYLAQVRTLRGLFPPEQVMVLKSEIFFADQRRAIDAICTYLGVPPLSAKLDMPAVRANASRSLPIPRSEWEAILPCFLDDIAGLEEDLGWDCSDWRQPPPSTQQPAGRKSDSQPAAPPA